MPRSATSGRIAFTNQQNLLLWSEQFDQAAAWAPSGVTITADTLDTLDPVGTNTADILVEDGNNCPHRVSQVLSVFPPSHVMTASLYAKKATRDWVQIQAVGGLARASFDISTGQLGAANCGSAYVSHEMESVGNGWYRCSLTFMSNGVDSSVYVYAQTVDDGYAYASTLGQKATYVWGAQVTKNNWMLPYVKAEAAIVGSGANTKNRASNRLSLGDWHWQSELFFGNGTPGIWYGADGSALVWLNGSFYRYGGWNSTAPVEFGNKWTTNECWKSDGTNLTRWTQVWAHDDTLPTGTTRPRRRHTWPFFTFSSGGHTYAVSIGGDMWDDITQVNPAGQGIYNRYPQDVWTTENMVTWTCRTDAAAFGQRVLHSGGYVGGKLYCWGGQTDITDNTSALATMYESSDLGATWSLTGSVPFTARCGIFNAPNFLGELWMVGGFVYGSPNLYFSDVWSWDGATWTQHADLPCSQKAYVTTAVFGGRIWLIGGHDGVGNTKEVWSTDDGENWDQMNPDDVPFYESHADSAAPNADLLCYSAGNFSVSSGEREVWQLREIAERVIIS